MGWSRVAIPGMLTLSHLDLVAAGGQELGDSGLPLSWNRDPMRAKGAGVFKILGEMAKWENNS